MRLTAEQLAAEGDDGGLIHLIDTIFLPSHQPERLGIAVSGGGDSMALLHLVWRWSTLTGVPIEAVTVNHGLRREAADEARMVAEFCGQMNVPHSILHWDGTAASGNIAAAGRDARYRLMGEWGADQDITHMLLGHTVDDIAETFLMRLARKSGVDGLSMMDTVFDRDGLTWGRPFWQQTRADLRDYLRRHDVHWVEDPTNEDERYERPKARKALAALEPLGLSQDVLMTVALNMSSARAALDYYVSGDAHRVIRVEGGDVLITTPANPPVPPETERRLLAAALRFVGGVKYPPRAEALVELDAGLAQSGKHTLAGCLITETDDGLRISREYNAVKEHQVPQGTIWDNRWLVIGPLTAKATIRALGDGIKDVPNWRETGIPRAALMATPAVYRGDWLISAPVAGLQNGFNARIVADFQTFLLSR